MPSPETYSLQNPSIHLPLHIHSGIDLSIFANKTFEILIEVPSGLLISLGGRVPRLWCSSYSSMKCVPFLHIFVSINKFHSFYSLPPLFILSILGNEPKFLHMVGKCFGCILLLWSFLNHSEKKSILGEERASLPDTPPPRSQSVTGGSRGRNSVQELEVEAKEVVFWTWPQTHDQLAFFTA